MKGQGLVIRLAGPADATGILAVAREVVEDGTTYAFAPDTPDAVLVEYFLPPAGETHVALVGGELAGFYVLRPNQVGRGSHVANASYAVARRHAGQGVGRALGLHSLERARTRGFEAMQFNFVVSTNTAAVALWRGLGFRIVGEVPAAFEHPWQGRVNVYLMHRAL